MVRRLSDTPPRCIHHNIFPKLCGNTHSLMSRNFSAYIFVSCFTLIFRHHLFHQTHKIAWKRNEILCVGGCGISWRSKTFNDNFDGNVMKCSSSIPCVRSKAASAELFFFFCQLIIPQDFSIACIGTYFVIFNRFSTFFLLCATDWISSHQSNAPPRNTIFFNWNCSADTNL